MSENEHVCAYCWTPLAWCEQAGPCCSECVEDSQQHSHHVLDGWVVES